MSATPPSRSSCVALAVLSPRVQSNGQLSTLSADAGAPLRRTPSPPSESAAPVPAPDTAAAPAPVMTDECRRVGRGGEPPASSASATRSTIRAIGGRRASPRPTRSQQPPPHRLHQPPHLDRLAHAIQKRWPPKYTKRSPCDQS